MSKGEHVSTDDLRAAQAWYSQTNDLLDIPEAAKPYVSLAFRTVRIHLAYMLDRMRGEENAIIIQRDENGEWPQPTVIAVRNAIWEVGAHVNLTVTEMEAVAALDALSVEDDQP